MTYQDYLNSGGEELYDKIDVNQAGKIAVRCICGQIAFSYAMIDVRNFEDHLTKGEKFICGGCYSTWERKKHKIDLTDDFLIPEEFTAKFIERQTGVKDVGAEKVRLECLEKEKKKIFEDELQYSSDSSNHPEKMALKSRRIKLEKRIKKG